MGGTASAAASEPGSEGVAAISAAAAAPVVVAAAPPPPPPPPPLPLASAGRFLCVASFGAISSTQARGQGGQGLSERESCGVPKKKTILSPLRFFSPAKNAGREKRKESEARLISTANFAPFFLLRQYRLSIHFSLLSAAASCKLTGSVISVGRFSHYILITFSGERAKRKKKEEAEIRLSPSAAAT